MGDKRKSADQQTGETASEALLPPILRDNPIERAERSYIRHAQTQHDWINRLFRWGALLAQFSAFGVAVIALLGLLVGLALGVPLSQVNYALFDYNNARFLHDMSVFMLCVTCLTFLLRKVELLSTTSASIHRERISQTFETMLLTGISARWVIIGKWWAAIRAHLPRHLMLIVMQAGCIAFVSLEQADLGFGTYIPPHLSTALVAFSLMTVYSLLDIGFTAAIGILASFVRRRSVSSAAVFMRGVVLAGFIALFFWSIYTYYPTYPDGTTNWDRMETRAPGLSVMISPVIDQGVISSSMLAMGQYADPNTGTVAPLYFNRFYAYSHAQLLAMLMVAIPFYMASTWGILRAAEALAVRDGVTPHHDAMAFKPKKRKEGKALNDAMPEAPRRLVESYSETAPNEQLEEVVAAQSQRP